MNRDQLIGLLMKCPNAQICLRIQEGPDEVVNTVSLTDVKIHRAMGDIVLIGDFEAAGFSESTSFHTAQLGVSQIPPSSPSSADEPPPTVRDPSVKAAEEFVQPLDIGGEDFGVPDPPDSDDFSVDSEHGFARP